MLSPSCVLVFRAGQRMAHVVLGGDLVPTVPMLVTHNLSSLKPNFKT